MGMGPASAAVVVATTTARVGLGTTSLVKNVAVLVAESDKCPAIAAFG